MKVTFKHNNGREQAMSARYAKILAALGRGSYQAGEVQQEELAFPGTGDTRTIQQVDAEIKAANQSLQVDQPAVAPVKASRAAVELAEASGVELAKIIGTGEAGAVTKPDVQAYIAAQSNNQEHAG